MSHDYRDSKPIPITDLPPTGIWWDMHADRGDGKFNKDWSAIVPVDHFQATPVEAFPKMMRDSHTRAVARARKTRNIGDLEISGIMNPGYDVVYAVFGHRLLDETD